MFIETEQTPNPEVLKFLPGRPVMGAKPVIEFKSAQEAQSQSPLASALFMVDGVTNVFFGADYISVSKQVAEEWFVMKPAILGVIMQHFVANQPVCYDNIQEGGAQEIYDEEDAAIVTQIKELLESRVRPAVAQDGGDIVFKGFERGIVYLSMRGACAGCPSATATLKMGIENLLKHFIPEVVEVRQSAAT